MIIVKKSGFLIFKDLRFRCAIGKNGIGNKKREGDLLTPKGTYRLTKVFYRPDRINTIKTKLEKKIIKKNMGWCDDSLSKFYNKPIILPNKVGHEKLYRRDNIYDIIVVLDFNINPIIKNKGSAIFIHLAKEKYQSTQGCIALKKNNLLKLLSVVKNKNKIKIM
jgi:L,D-peptidoglycan transpeptidase YkuD (ErfK/YbiS/YcfS/YnhG family)